MLTTPSTDGVQVQPAHLWVPPHASTAGGEAADFAESYGITLDPEQRLVVDALLAEREDGRWSTLENAIVAARQNLKTLCFEVIVLADLFLFGAELVVWTAHLFPTTMEAFRDLTAFVTNFDHLRKRVKRISNANGEEGIELVSGQRILFKARTKSGGRGFTGDTLILDEAMFLTASMMGSTLPLLSARPNPHVFYGSSAGKLESEVLRGVRDRGRAGGDPSLSYVEFGDDPPTPCAVDRCDHRIDTEGCALDDEAAIRRANTALGRRITMEHVRAERRALATEPMEFARERLGWWEDPDKGTTALPLVAWQECRDRQSQAAPRAFAYAAALDSSWSTIAMSGTRADGLEQVEVIDYRQGTVWLADRLSELCERYGVAEVAALAKGPEAALSDEVQEALGFAVRQVKAEEHVEACGELLDRLGRRAFRHIGQPELDVCAKRAARRPVGEAWVWSRRLSPLEISPLVAVTLASWAARQLAVAATETGFVALDDWLDDDEE